MENLRELCEGYNINNMTYWRNMPSGKASVIRNQLGINQEEPILFYDSTVFGSGKNGLAVCESGIYWKDLMCPAKYLSWKSFRSLKLSKSTTLLYFGEDYSCSVFSSDIDQLYNMLGTIRVGAKIDNFVQKTTGFFGFLDKASTFLSELDTTIKESQTESLDASNSQIAPQSSKIVELASDQILSESDLWTIACKGSTFGPFTVSEVRNWLILNKDAQDKIYLWKKGMPNWEPIANITEFSNYFKTLNELPPLPDF